VTRNRLTALAGLGTALLCNYWLLEWWLSERTDTPRSWISDLATRTEATGWRFQLLAILSGLAICAFAVMLLRRDEGRLRRGLFALLATGAFATIAGASPLSCPEGIEPGCTLAEDPGDVIHALATGGEIVATVLAFLLLGVGLISRCGRSSFRYPARNATAGWGFGPVTLAIGVVWLLLTAVTGLAYLSGDVDAVKGILQRVSQVLFGGWLALLGWWFAVSPGR
jgi:hypothetical protein